MSKSRLDRIEKIFEETDSRINKLSVEVDKVNKSVADLTGSWGWFVEGMTAPSAVKYIQDKGFKITEVFRRLNVSKNGMSAEYDSVVITRQKIILVVSVKSRAKSRDIDELLEDIDNFFYFFEHYKKYKLIGAIAGMSFGNGIEKYALRKGLVVMKPSGEIFQVHEPKKVKFFTKN
jgi:hypothetical protein